MGRFNVNLVMFGDSRTSTVCPWGGHRIQFATSEHRLRASFEDAGLSCRSGRRQTWRHETARVNYDEACAVTDKIQQLDSRIEVVRKAMLVNATGSFQEFPASHFHPGMSIAVYQEGKIVEDIIADIKFSDYSGEVYDLDVSEVHNFICQDVVCHNSVYSWRGSDFNIILGFQHDFEGTKIIKLEQNYRSTQTILEAANRVIERNRQRLPKTLFATEELGQGDKIRYYQSYDGEGEASFVAEKIGEHLRRSPDARSAVLYRTNAQSRLFEESLRRRGIAYNIVGGFSFYERAEVKDIIAYLKLALNPHDDIAMMRVINSPPRGIGKTTIDTLSRQQRDLDVSLWETIAVAIDQRTIAQRAASALDVFRQVIISLSERVLAAQPLSDIVKAATLETGYVRALEEEKTEEAEGRLLNIEELVSAAVEAEEQDESLRDFIDHAALVSDTDQYKADARVTLMTMHSAKGLEFPVVFIVGVEEGLFPHSRAAGSEEELEEERRLCYVAITRAQRHLYITHAMRRRTFGEEHPAEPSRFLNEIPLELLENMSAGPSWLGFAARADTRHNLSALKGESREPSKKRSTFSGKTYNSVESVRDFFNRQTGSRAAPPDRERAGESQSQTGELRVGARVRHARYGAGVVLRIEGSGPDAKLTVSFPGFGQKKFVARYAALEKA
jgi:DNA helicase-2/ATP-dependent DNA helicase PcrA